MKGHSGCWYCNVHENYYDRFIPENDDNDYFLTSIRGETEREAKINMLTYLNSIGKL